MEPSLSEQAYQSLRKDILTCALAPGLPITQPGLVESYGIGMTPIREALQRLVREGFVRPVSRLGFMVSPITPSDVREVYELRTLHEVAAVRWACVRATDEQLRELRGGAAFSYGIDPESRWEYVSRNAAFHLAIAAAAGNQRLVGLVSRQLDDLTRVLFLGLEQQGLSGERAEEHVALADVLCSRDADRAEEVMRRQIDRSLQTILESVARSLTESPPGGLGRTVSIERRGR